jgi:hypothetical protein
LDYPKAQGKEEFLRFQKGERLTMKEAILANCFQCAGFYSDGRKDCDVNTCPLHAFMPYNKDRVRRIMSEEQRNQIRDRFKQAVSSRGAL